MEMNNTARQLDENEQAIFSIFNLWFVARSCRWILNFFFIFIFVCLNVCHLLIIDSNMYIPLDDWFVEQRRCHGLNGMDFCDGTCTVPLRKHFRYAIVGICSMHVIRCIRIFDGWQVFGRRQINTSRNGCNEPRTIWNLIEYAIAALCCVNWWNCVSVVPIDIEK